MTSIQEATHATSAPSDLMKPFLRLKRGYERNRNPSLRERLRNLKRLEEVVIKRRDDISDAIREDFGGRSAHQSQLVEVFMTVEAIRYARRHLSSWLKTQKRRTSLAFLPAKTTASYQPKGVVGIISPWNYPVNLALAPAAGALAAGNRIMIKPSELTPATSDLMVSMMREAFDDDHVNVVTGGAQVGADFSSLPFDHLVFTGSTRVGRMVMKAAAENLTPVTLELGGKSPTIVHESYPLASAAEAITLGKWFNSGQTCIAPDYILAPENRVDALISAIESSVRIQYPYLRENPDYTAVVSDQHHCRLQGLVDDAKAKGAQVIEINPGRESFDGTRKLVPTILTGVSDDMAVMQEEIFGPVLPIVPYRNLDDAIRYVNDRPRPLALYYFDHDSVRADHVLDRTVSGGASINACLLHYAQDDLPFGGIGPSGMGSYHGKEGFETFSHKKPVFHQARVNAASLLAPPYGKTVENLLRVLLRV